MKIFAVYGNYDVPTADSLFAGERQILLMADSSLLPPDRPLFVPDFDNDFRLFPSMAVKIHRLGKSIAPRFAYRYYDIAAPAANLVACGELARRRAEGCPWSMAAAFDMSAIVMPYAQLADVPDPFRFSMSNSAGCVEWDVGRLCASLDEIISIISSRFKLCTGDIIFPGFSGEGLPVKINDHVTFEGPDLKRFVLKIK